MTSPISRARVVVLYLGVLTVGAFPPFALADDAARISRLESEIQLLRTRIDEQHRRILRLEDELKRGTGNGPVRTVPERHVDGVAIDRPAATESLPWHAAESWARVTTGMSEAEVTEILGPPTSVESIDSYKTLFYRGPVAGSGSMSGIVNLRDGRVVAVNAPDF
jgi:hypothetical protein